MLDWTAAPPTWKPRPFDAPRLLCEAVPRDCLTARDREEMCRLLAAYFQNTSPAQFERDLAEKDTAILLRRPADGRIAGFSTLMALHVSVDGRPVVGFFSGDTIIARDCWGSSSLGRLWLNVVFQERERIRRDQSGELCYWFLISSGYKTWRYLPVFFARYLPHPEQPAPAFDRLVLQTLATTKFGDQYDPQSGVVRFRSANPLRPGVADITERRRCDPMVDFFVRMNPGHARGDELACLAAVSRSNLTPAGLRWLDAGARV